MSNTIVLDEDKFDSYLKLRYSESTKKQYLNFFRSHIDVFLSQSRIDRFLGNLSEKSKDNPFYRAFLKAVISCFELPLMVPKSLRKGKKYVAQKPKFLDKEEVDHIIKHGSPWVSIVTRVMWDTGLRLRELINAEWDNIDIDERTIQGMGKNNKPFTVKFSMQTSDYLLNYMNSVRRDFPFHEDDSDKDHAKTFWRKLKQEAQEMGIYNVHPHRIRHALGHHLRADKGFDLEQIRVKLRHSKLETTGIYTKAAQEEVDDLMDEKVFS